MGQRRTVCSPSRHVGLVARRAAPCAALVAFLGGLPWGPGFFGFGPEASARPVAAPRLRLAPAGADGPLSDTSEAAEEAVGRARDVIDAAVADGVHRGADFGGLTVLRGAVGAGRLRQMRGEAEAWLQKGWLQPTGQDGRGDLTCYLTREEALAAGAPGIAYGVELLCSVCDRLNELGASPRLEPARVQLACYDGSPDGYPAHRDAYSLDQIREFSPDASAQEHEVLAARRLTALLYLQDGEWDAGWGGALRAHGADVDLGAPAEECVDVLPDGGQLVLFRACDLAHEVLPSKRRRLALTLWSVREGVPWREYDS